MREFSQKLIGATGRMRGGRIATLTRVFTLLSEIFLEPEADPGQELRALAGDLPELLKVSVKDLARARATDQPADSGYIDLFLGGADGRAVPVYESVYRSGRYMDPDILVGLKRLYEEAGLPPRHSHSLAPDHLSRELDCLVHCLSEWQEDAGSTGPWRDLTNMLLGQHLCPFAHAFSARLEESAPRTFYFHAAQTLCEALRFCHEEILRTTAPPKAQ
jgi:TorA maturation chaperone TorD